MDEGALRRPDHPGRGRPVSPGAGSVRMAVGAGLTAPLAAQLLDVSGVPRPAESAGPPAGFTPARRGGGGELKTLWWQAPTILNPHLAIGVKDGDGSRIFYEPLVLRSRGERGSGLAAEVPTLQNGGIARDGLSVTVKLKKGVQWHDGKPFTADDVVFTWEYAADPATAASTPPYRDIARVDRLDQHTVKIVYKAPEPVLGERLPEHHLPSTSSSRSGAGNRAKPRPT